MKNIINLTTFGALLLVCGAAALIVSPVFWAPVAGVVIYTPNLVSEIE